MNAYIYVDIKILVNLGILVGPYLTPHGSIILCSTEPYWKWFKPEDFLEDSKYFFYLSSLFHNCFG